MRRAWVLSVALLFACQESDSEPAGDDGSSSGDAGSGGETEGVADTDLPSPYTGGTTGDEPQDMPSMGPDQAATSAVAGLQAFVNLRPMTVIDAFESLVSPEAGTLLFEEGCPEEFSDVPDENGARAIVWYTEGCMTSTGLQIQGSGRFSRYTDLVEGDSTRSGAMLSADGGTFSIRQGDRWLQFSGYMEVSEGTYAEGVDGYFGFSGEASADPMTAMGAPLLDGSVTANGSLYAGIFGGYKAIGGSGSLSGDVLGQSRAMSFADVLAVGEACGAEPAGTVAVRDDQGYWHDIVFDAATQVGEEYEWDAAACDGCGAYLAGGVANGDVCIDGGVVASLLDWEEIPW